jgi:hypothetical protein
MNDERGISAGVSVLMTEKKPIVVHSPGCEKETGWN